jgi:hypothetical protein
MYSSIANISQALIAIVLGFNEVVNISRDKTNLSG